MRGMRILAALTALVLAAPAWTDQPSGVTARLRGVSAVSDRVAWASGSAGTVLRTGDGGATWQSMNVPGAEKLDFRDIDAVSEQIAYVLSIGSGESSRIYKTVDGGRTWALQFTNTDPKAFFDAMAFWDADRGIAFSDSVDGRLVILRTDNGGRVWTRVPAEGLPPRSTTKARSRQAARTSRSMAAITSGSAPAPQRWREFCDRRTEDAHGRRRQRRLRQVRHPESSRSPFATPTTASSSAATTVRRARRSTTRRSRMMAGARGRR